MLLLNALILLVVMLVAKWLTGMFIFVLFAVLAFAAVAAILLLQNRRRKGQG